MPPTSDPPDSIPWSKVVEKGSKLRVPKPLARYSALNEKSKPTFETIYEAADLKERLLVDRASKILEEALQPSAVLFSISKNDFDNHIAVYRLISNQIGPLSGARVISSSGKSSTNQEVIIQANFVTLSDTQKAIESGFQHNEKMYRGISANDNSPIQLRNVRIAMIPFAAPVSDVDVEIQRVKNTEALVSDLQLSLAPYGKVCKIQRLLYEGFFEGEISVLLDSRPTENGDAVQPLTRMLYLHQFQKYCPASFKGASPVCYHCRQTGHIVAKCPKLASIKCYKCNGNGHIARFCKKQDDDEAKTNDKNSAESQKTDTSLSKKPANAKFDGAANDIDMPLSSMNSCNEDEIVTDVESILNEDSDNNENKTVSSPRSSSVDTMEFLTSTDEEKLETIKRLLGSDGSKFASTSVRSTMDLDLPERLLDLVNSVTTADSTKLNQRKTHLPSNVMGTSGHNFKLRTYVVDPKDRANPNNDSL